MAESSWPAPSNGRVVDDVGWEKIGQTLGPVAGVLGEFSSPQLISGDSSGMQVKVAADRYALVGGHIWYSGAAIFSKTIAANASGSTRTDLVVIRLSRTTWEATVVVITGTPGSGPPAPTQNTGTTGSFDLPLATVTVASGASTVAAGNVFYVATHIPLSGTMLRVTTSAALPYVPLPSGGTQAYVADFGFLKMYNSASSTWVDAIPGQTAYSGVMTDSTVISGISSTTFAAGSPVVGFAFTAPPSGIIVVTVGGWLQSNNNGGDCRLGYEIRNGSILGSGTVVWAATYIRALNAGSAVNASAPARLGASYSIPTGSLTPGNPYNIRTMHGVSTGGTGQIEYRSLIVEPWMN